jgi:septal ring factor EnvC (AmiA/AmiB activator)
MRCALPLALFLAVAAPAPAQEGTAKAAAQAARQLEEAARLLGDVEGAEDRLAALTVTVRAYEEGLALLRDALRRVSEERSRVEAEIATEHADLAGLLGALQSVGRAPEEALLLHPDGPLATAQAGILLTDAADALQAEAQALRARLDRLAEIARLQEEAAAPLREGLADVQEARAALAAAAADRTELPRAYTEDPVATALLIASTASLEEFATGLAQTVDEEIGASPDERDRRGTLALPVEATIIRRFGESDAAGVARPGIVLATEPRALVAVPVTATLRFRGPLLDYGTVAILEPAPGTLLVLAGLAQVWGEAGEILAEGAPLGLMAGETPSVEAILGEVVPPSDVNLTGAPSGGSSEGTETLYLEVRENGAPVDPATWFRLD